jgi:prevent-host-death family protein
MRWREPVTETINVTEARRGWSRLLDRVFKREARVIVEKSGIPVAAIISIQEYEFFLDMKARREERFKILDEMRAAFADVPPEEIEREVAKAIAEGRAENCAHEQAGRKEAAREQTERDRTPVSS